MVAWKSLGIAGLGLAMLGCGPVQYITTVTSQAASEVAAAKSADAEKYAPFEYTAAQEYLHKAREEEGYADHEAAVRFGRLARDNAIKAKKLALEKAGQPVEPNPATLPPRSSGEQEIENPLEQVHKK